MNNDNRFRGTWNLLSVHLRIGDRNEYELPSEVGGMIMMDDQYMSTQVTMPDRLKFVFNELPAILSQNMLNIVTGLFMFPLKEPKQAFNSFSQVFVRFPLQGYAGYFGKYTVDEEEQTITTLVDGGSYGDLVGEKLTRNFTFSEGEDILTLEALPTNFIGQEIILRAHWERLGGSSTK